MTKKYVTAFDRVLAKRLRFARQMKGLTMEQLAGKLSISWQQLQKHERAESRITAERLYLVCKELDLPYAFFLGRDDASLDLAEEASADALKLAGRIETLPDHVIRYCISSLVTAINEAWGKRDHG